MDYPFPSNILVDIIANTDTTLNYHCTNKKEYQWKNCVRPSSLKLATVKGQLYKLFNPDLLYAAGLVDFEEAQKLKNANFMDTGGFLNCVPLYSEALTKSGWKRIDELQSGEEICISNWDGKLYFSPILSLIKKDEPEALWNFQHRSGNFLTTENHRNWCKTRRNIKEIRLTSELKNNERVDLITSGIISNADNNFNLNELKLLGFILGDGSLDCGNGNNINISVLKPRKKEYIKNLGLDYLLDKDHITDNGTYTIYTIPNANKPFYLSFVTEKTKKINFESFLNLSEKEMLAVLEGMSQSDGRYVANKPIHSFINTNPDLITLYQTLLHLTGNTAGNIEWLKNDTGFNRDRHYVKDIATVRRISDSRSNKLSFKAPIETKIYDKVGCVSVETGLWLVRQNGRILITGNCLIGNLLHRLYLPAMEDALCALGVSAKQEHPLISRKYCIRGQADLVLFDHTEKTMQLVDLKTTGPAILDRNEIVSDDYMRQLLAYGLCLEELYPDYKLEACCILSLSKIPNSNIITPVNAQAEWRRGEVREIEVIKLPSPIVAQWEIDFNDLKNYAPNKKKPEYTLIKFFSELSTEVIKVNEILKKKIKGYDHWTISDKAYKKELSIMEDEFNV